MPRTASIAATPRSMPCWPGSREFCVERVRSGLSVARSARQRLDIHLNDVTEDGQHGQRIRPARRTARVARPRGHRPAGGCRRDGYLHPAPCRPEADRGAGTDALPAPVDRGHLRLPVGGLAHHEGTLSDRIGRRRLVLIGAAAFALASTAAAFSTTPEMLIAARAVMGVAGATLAPSTLPLIRNTFLSEQQRAVAVGIWIGSFSVGAALGPFVGGVLLETFWWGAVFLVPVPVMALLLVIGPRLLPELRDPKAGRLDLTSAALSGAAVLAAVYGMKIVAQATQPGRRPRSSPPVSCLAPSSCAASGTWSMRSSISNCSGFHCSVRRS